MRIALLVSVTVLLLAGCVPVQSELSPLPTGTQAPMLATDTQTPVEPVPTPDPALATVIGSVVSKGTDHAGSLTGMPVRLAQVFWNEDKSDGAFVLEGATSPSTLIRDDGTFTLSNVPPADYVIVVGDPMGQNMIITEPDGKARVITLVAGQTFDVGKLEVILSSTS